MNTNSFCNISLECGCNTNGSLVSICDDTTGLCLCKPNIIGAKCDSCDSGYTGFPDCIQDLFGGQGNLSIEQIIFQYHTGALYY